MSFYEEISKYYDAIFPVSDETVDYIRTVSGNPPVSILDVACGTGSYSIELEKHGYHVTAVDIDKAMIDGLKEKAESIGSKVDYIQAGMLDLKERFKDRVFHVVFCIGNSLVHLDDYDEINVFFQDARSILAEDGKLIIQTINFDRVISKDVKSLPTILNEPAGLRFERYYRYEKAVNKVFFKTILSVEDKRIENEIPLTPVRCEETIHMLKNAGFSKVKVYGGFNQSDYDKENSYLTVMEAQ